MEKRLTGRIHAKNGYWFTIINTKAEGGKYKPVWQSTSLTEKGNKMRAQQILADRILQMEQDMGAKQTADAALPMSDLILQYLRIKKEDLRENTYISYEETATFHVIPHFRELGILVTEIQPKHIQEYYRLKSEGGLSRGTLERHRTILRGSLEYAVETLGIREDNPADRVRLPKKKGTTRKPTFYTREQLQALLLAVKGTTLEAPVTLSAIYGLRRSEVLGLRWDVVDLEHNAFVVSHTAVRVGSGTRYADTVKEEASRRSTPISSRMQVFFHQLKRRQEEEKELSGNSYLDNSYLCKRFNGEPLTPDYITQAFRKFLKKQGLPPIRFHDLRHSSASLLINKKHTLKEVQAWLGHAKSESTDIYAHLLFESKKEMSRDVEAELFGKEEATLENS